jgi:hypothetical protein
MDVEFRLGNAFNECFQHSHPLEATVAFALGVIETLECERFSHRIDLCLNSNPFYQADKGTAERIRCRQRLD